MARSTKTLTVSLPPSIYEEVERLARQENKTKSELFRDMVRVYEEYPDERGWWRLRSLGGSSAKRIGIESEEDIEKLVHEARA